MMAFKRRLLALWRVLTNRNFILLTNLILEDSKAYYISILNRTDFTNAQDSDFISMAHEYYIKVTKEKSDGK